MPVFQSPHAIEERALQRVEQRHREASDYALERLGRSAAPPFALVRVTRYLIDLGRSVWRRQRMSAQGRSDAPCETSCPERLAGTCRCAQLGQAT